MNTEHNPSIEALEAKNKRLTEVIYSIWDKIESDEGDDLNDDPGQLLYDISQMCRAAIKETAHQRP